MVKLQEIKDFLHVSYDDDNNNLLLLLDNVNQYMADSIDDYEKKLTNYKFQKKIKFIMLVIIKDMYDRQDWIMKDQSRCAYILQSQMLQMQYCEY